MIEARPPISVSPDDTAPPSDGSTPVDSGWNARPPSDRPAIRFPCPTCGRRLRATSNDAGKAITCPECNESLRVPDFAEPDAADDSGEAKPRKKKRRRPAGLPPVVDRAGGDPPPKSEPLAPLSPLDRLAEYREEIPDPPPTWTFLSGVFGVPLQAKAVGRWACLAFGLALTGLVFTVVLAMAGGLSGGFGAGGAISVVIAFFILPLFWLGFYTFSYAAACCMAIVEETAGGRHLVEGWPEPNWKEWAGTFIPLMYLLLVTAAVAWGVGQLAEPDWQWPTFGIAIVVLYPFLFLSALESGQPWLPLSFAVTGSLFTLWWAWLTFYALFGFVSLFWIGSIWIGAVKVGHPYLTSMATAPILGWAMFVNARLLGRMAWRIAERGVSDPE